MEIGRLQHSADAARRTGELRVWLIEDQRPPGRRRGQPKQHPQRRRLPGPVWAEEARDRPCLERERQIIDSRQPTKSLRQTLAQHYRHDYILTQPSNGGGRW
jgi:hypothetical protein